MSELFSGREVSEEQKEKNRIAALEQWATMDEEMKLDLKMKASIRNLSLIHI